MVLNSFPGIAGRPSGGTKSTVAEFVRIPNQLNSYESSYNREAEPRTQCVPRLSLGTRANLYAKTLPFFHWLRCRLLSVIVS